MTLCLCCCFLTGCPSPADESKEAEEHVKQAIPMAEEALKRVYPGAVLIQKSFHGVSGIKTGPDHGLTDWVKGRYKNGGEEEILINVKTQEIYTTDEQISISLCALKRAYELYNAGSWNMDGSVAFSFEAPFCSDSDKYGNMSISDMFPIDKKADDDYIDELLHDQKYHKTYNLLIDEDFDMNIFKETDISPLGNNVRVYVKQYSREYLKRMNTPGFNPDSEAEEPISIFDTEAGDEMNEEEKAAFAAGISTEEESTDISSDTEAVNEEAAVVLTDEIEERCPITCSAHRGDVTYGEFSHGTYYSETCGMERGYSILLPADYSKDKQYPVLYLLHGIFGDEYSFSGDSGNKIKEIAGNMAADGFMEETIIVCPNMYASSDPDQKPAFDAESCLPYDNFINDLVNDLMPYIESEYPVLTGRENTYLAGFSMGGRETIFITLQRPELFGYVCAISAAPGIVPTTDKFMTHPGQIAESEMKFADGAITPNVFIICCGTRDSVVGTYPKSYHELLEKNGSEHIWYEITGADHDNTAIQSGIYNLFKQIACKKTGH